MNRTAPRQVWLGLPAIHLLIRRCLISPRVFRTILFLPFLLLTVSGCSGIRNDYPEKALFRLSAGPIAGPLAGSLASPAAPCAQDRRETAPPLLVHQLDISPEFETDALVYRTGENRFKSDFYHSFAASPARMITDIVQETLFDSGLFTPAGPSAVSGERYQLRGKIIDLYADLREKDGFCAVVALRLILETPAGSEPGPVVHKIYREKIPFTPLDPDRYIDSLNQGLARILTDFIRDFEAAAPGDHVTPQETTEP